MPDGTVVETFLDRLNTEEQEEVYRHLFRRPDFSVVVVDSLGQVDLISSNARSALNEQGGKVTIGKDNDYLKLLAKNPKENVADVYKAHLTHQP